MNPTHLVMHMLGKFSTGQAKDPFRIAWTTVADAEGSFASPCTGPPSVPSPPLPSNATRSSTLR